MVLTDDNTGNTDENPEEEKEEELHSAHGAGRGVILYTEYTLHALLFIMPAGSAHNVIKTSDGTRAHICKPFTEPRNRFPA
jgi:hypothetical protein